MPRRSRFALFIATLAGLSLSCGASIADDWPQWQGPNRDAISHETGLLKSWPEGGPPRTWLFEDCGVGYGGPAIVDGKVYILGARGDDELLICLNENSGAEQWALKVGDLYENDWGNGPRSTPTIVDDRAYVISARGNVSCVDLNRGEILWQTSMADDLGGKIPNWGYSESPLVIGDRLYCTPGGEQGAIAALDTTAGEVVWQASELVDPAHYASIRTQEVAGKTSLVQLLLSQLVGVDIETGAVQWSEPWPGSVAVIPTPVISGSKAYATSGYGIGCMLVEVDENHDATKVYENKVMKCKHDGTVLLDGSLYGYSDGVGWVCQDFDSGESIWRERSALDKGAIGYADDRLYCVSENEGEVVLIAATTEGWQEHGRFTLDPQTTLRKDRGKIWTHPVVCNGRLYLRDQNLVYCYNVKQTGQSAGKTDRR